jgi:malonate decarboxylase epsilon subunit
MRYVSNCGARAVQDADAIREDLATNVAQPVRWCDTLEVLRELGATLFLERALGHVSTQRVAQWLPGVRAVSIRDRGLRYAAVIAARENSSDFRASVP